MAWVVVRAYYAAFFAAHAICRALGSSLTFLDAPASNTIDRVADLYSMRMGVNFQKGLYVVSADAASKSLTLRKPTGEGSHEALWSHFTGLMRNALPTILTRSKTSVSALQASAVLSTIEDGLTNGGRSPNGNWLSTTRNRINYQHALSVWYPYQNRPEYYDRLIEKTRAWQTDPETQTIWPQQGRDVQRAIETCVLVVSVCRVICQDLGSRCPAGKSFMEFGPLNLLRHL
jgi:hypothetical protein